jgi:hypothetical protein
MKGYGMFVHTDPADHPAETFGSTTTPLSGPDTRSTLLLPRVPMDDHAPTTRRGPFPA